MPAEKATLPTVVFATQYFMPEPGSTPEILSGIAKALARREFNVRAIAGQPSYLEKFKIDRVFESDGVRVERVWSTQIDKDRPWGRVLNSVTFALSVLVYLLRDRKRYLTVAVTQPPQLPWVYLAARRVVGTRYVLLVYDVYPDLAVAMGVLPAGGWVARICNKINKMIYASAERIVVLGRDMQRVIEATVESETKKRITIIPNWADAREIVPVLRSRNPLLKQIHAENRFVVQYSGNIGRIHEIETILAAARLLQNDQAYLFLFIGSGQQLSAVQKEAGRSADTNIMLLPFQPRARLGITLTACDVGIVALKAGLSGLSVPSKLYGILAAGKPVVVIGPEDCEAALLVKEKKCGEVVPPGDGKALADCLKALRDDPERMDRYGKSARAAFEEAFDIETVADMWANILRDVEPEK